MAPRSKDAPAGISRLLGILALLTGLLASVFYVLEQNLDKFYVLDLEHLDDVSKRALAEHGNDTRAVVKYITDELHEKLPAHINLNEEWVFNNAGGAMGAMYIIHASRSTSCRSWKVGLLIIYRRHHRIPHHLRHRHRHRRPHGPPHGRRLLPHPLGHAAGLRARRVRARGVPPGEHPPPGARHRQAVQDARGLLRHGVRPGMDPAHALLWVRGWVVEHAGFPDLVAHDEDYGTGDDFELAQGEVLEQRGFGWEVDEVYVVIEVDGPSAGSWRIKGPYQDGLTNGYHLAACF